LSTFLKKEAFLKGIAEDIHDDHCIINVNGVGYLIFISNKTSNSLKNLSENSMITFIIQTIVKEDAIELYGFLDQIDKVWFNELMKVQGIGAKMAQKILSQMTIQEITKALISEDSKTFNNISGIGPKMASRIITELKNSAQKIGIIDYKNDIDSDKIYNNSIVNDAISALENLGYKKHDSLKIINNIYSLNESITLENLITKSLKEINIKKFN
jgi:Holliday junction DNA helicase RuvA